MKLGALLKMGAFLISGGILIKENEMNGWGKGGRVSFLRHFLLTDPVSGNRVLQKFNGITKVLIVVIKLLFLMYYQNASVINSIYSGYLAGLF